MKNFKYLSVLFIAGFFVLSFNSCKDEDPVEPVKACMTCGIGEFAIEICEGAEFEGVILTADNIQDIIDGTQGLCK